MLIYAFLRSINPSESSLEEISFSALASLPFISHSREVYKIVRPWQWNLHSCSNCWIIRSFSFSSFARKSRSLVKPVSGSFVSVHSIVKHRKTLNRINRWLVSNPRFLLVANNLAQNNRLVSVSSRTWNKSEALRIKVNEKCYEN